MEYTKQNFTDGQVLTAEHLNHIEDAIVNIVTAINTGGTTTDLPSAEEVAF